ncbi:MAG: type II secretion system protein GspG [Candidatus Omnitrophica bacterium]|nr:type II secretion system protein GspG [Candidatus Omnitrophota bacterium]
MRTKTEKKGISVVELLVFIVILMIIAGISFKLVYSVNQKAKIVKAKAEITQFVIALENMKDDTGYYPVRLGAIFDENPPAGMEKNWHGPYATKMRDMVNSDTPLDPWGNPYFYEIPATDVPPVTYIQTPEIGRFTGPPRTYTYNFTAPSGPAYLVLTNYGITSGEIRLNGAVIIEQSEFRNSPRPQIITRPVTLLAGTNTLSCWLASTPHDYYLVSVGNPATKKFLPTFDYFIITSYGRDKKSGGKGFDRDIIYNSKTYPNFQ